VPAYLVVVSFGNLLVISNGGGKFLLKAPQNVRGNALSGARVGNVFNRVVLLVTPLVGSVGSFGKVASSVIDVLGISPELLKIDGPV
jgi:hypothetical protein